MHTLHGRRALVTGGSRGIGRELARALAEAGVAVAIGCHARRGEADDVRQAIDARGGRAIVVQGDVGSAADAARIVAESIAALGGLDILINNAGIAIPTRLDALTEADWDHTVDTNLKSAFLVTQAALPAMRARRWGRLIFLSSVAAQVGGVIGPHYAASKAGLHGLMHYYASHLAKEGITANAVAPALIDTDMVRNNPNARADLIPIGRFGASDEVAAVVMMLVANGYITGQVVNVNGGWYLT